MECIWDRNWPRNLQLYVDVELFQGNGISDGIGLAGYVNGDVIRAGSSNLPKIPYLARYYFRYFVPLSSETEKVERSMDQLPGEQPVSRWEIKFGRLALSDDFDQNRYANNNRTQFMNYDFLFNTAWDYAADTRGYTSGLSRPCISRDGNWPSASLCCLIRRTVPIRLF